MYTYLRFRKRPVEKKGPRNATQIRHVASPGAPDFINSLSAFVFANKSGVFVYRAKSVPFWPQLYEILASLTGPQISPTHSLPSRRSLDLIKVLRRSLDGAKFYRSIYLFCSDQVMLQIKPAHPTIQLSIFWPSRGTIPHKTLYLREFMWLPGWY